MLVRSSANSPSSNSSQAASSRRTRAQVPPIDAEAPSHTQVAAFALGCFWGPDARFGVVPGVVRTCVGYAGGSTPDPSYHELGDHIETVQVTYDPSVVSYRDLLDRFWHSHNPARQPWKRQYMSALFPQTDEQLETARAAMQHEASRHDDDLGTEIIEDTTFYRAEAYHQKYRLRQHPELRHAFEAMYGDEQQFVDSTAAARVNGYVAGHGTPAQLADDLPRLGLPEDAEATLEAVAARHN